VTCAVFFVFTIHQKEKTMDENLLKQALPEAQQPANAGMSIPEKFRDPETGALRSEALLKSYIELEKRLSQGGNVNALQDNGCPDCADDYEIDLSHGLFDRDDLLNQKLFEKGFSNDQVQTVYDVAAEKLVPMILDMASEFQADREIERLVSEFGGAEKWQEVSRQLLAYGQKNLPQDVLSGLAGSYEGVMALYRMMNTEQPMMREGTNAEGLAGEDELKSMMSDPKYWKAKDPAYIARVTKGFKALYGDNK
jgi:hypothetical protein